MGESADEFLKFLESKAQITSMFTEFRDQFISQGWTPEGAEAATLQIMKTSVDLNTIHKASMSKGRR